MTRAPSLERFDPRDRDGTLIDVEHRGRYWWAAVAAAGGDVLDAGCGTGYGMAILRDAGAASVTGIDIDPGAVAATARRIGDAGAVVQGDIRELPFEDASFDAVVCFETIEHMDRGESVLGELQRVLRPEGVLFVSSPNPDVYPPGNEHHVHEFRPDELAAAVGEHFATVATFRQHAWLSSVIEPSGDETPGPAVTRPPVADIRTCATLDEGGETYGIVVASDASTLPSMPRLIALGATFEVKWWSEQVEEAERAARQLKRAAEESVRTQVEAVQKEAHARLAEVQNDAGHAVAQAKAAEGLARARGEEMGRALLEANQALARLPILEHRSVELAGENERLAHRLAIIEGSRSWRMAGPLRRLRGLLR